jgi:hypothetical protein
LPISSKSCGSGRAPSFSDSGVALTMTMNRIAKSPFGCAMVGWLVFGFSYLWLTGELRLRAQLDRFALCGRVVVAGVVNRNQILRHDFSFIV